MFKIATACLIDPKRLVSIMSVKEIAWKWEENKKFVIELILFLFHELEFNFTSLIFRYFSLTFY